MKASFWMAGGVLTLALWGCGADPAVTCDEYVAAYNVCAAAAGSAPQDAAEVCASATESQMSQYACLTEAYQSDDCSTEAGLAHVGDAAQDCLAQ